MLCGRKASGLLPLAIARIALLRGEYSDFVSALINMVFPPVVVLYCLITQPVVRPAATAFTVMARGIPAPTIALMQRRRSAVINGPGHGVDSRVPAVIVKHDTTEAA